MKPTFNTTPIELSSNRSTVPCTRRIQRGELVRWRSGFSIAEVLVVMTIMGIMIAMAVPSFRRGLEQARADVAACNLRGVWAAQRIYWLENRSYASSLADLVNAGLLDPQVTDAQYAQYEYSLNVGLSSNYATSFIATASRVAGSSWTGTFTINQEGALAGSICSTTDFVSQGQPFTIDPSFQ